MRLDPKFRTDLALEAADTGDNQLPEGVFVDTKTLDGITKTVVNIKTPQASERLGRPIGNYVTLEGPFTNNEALVTLLTDELSVMLPDGPSLVIGLGNRQITPDTLGSEVADKIIATAHISQKQREEVGLTELRDVCVMAPGVMGQTGLETAEIVSMVASNKKFASIICVDALAARSAQRLCTTIQLSDSGISPGSGVHNRREEISKATMGVPVFSLGVPTVVDAVTLANDLCQQSAPTELRQNMIVTPRDIDVLSAQAAKIIATSLNITLQNKLDSDVVRELMS